MYNQESWINPGEKNIFQKIKLTCANRESQGLPVWRLSIGQPVGPALISARLACSAAVMSESEEMHSYQDNVSPGVPHFAEDFVQLHLKRNLLPFIESEQIMHLPIPGIKPMLGQVIAACGSFFRRDGLHVTTMTDPGYSTPADQCRYLKARHTALETNPENGFLFDITKIEQGVKLVMANYPHNPSGQVASKDFWRKCCEYCQKNRIALVNDAALAKLAHEESSLLSEVAVDYPKLRWAELFSASKTIANGTGWRIGALVGSKTFLMDIATIKGNTDSGFFAPAAAGVMEALWSDDASIEARRLTYSRRLDILIALLEKNGLRLAVRPKAGFFTLWQVPQKAFGQKIRDGKEFNQLLIEKTGVAGIPFGAFVRYAVTSPIDYPEWSGAIDQAFKQAEVSYD